MLNQLFNALPFYFGGKRRLTPWIGSTLDRVCPSDYWSKMTFIDLFCGGGSVALYAKAQGFNQVIINDTSTRSRVIAEAFSLNNHVKLSLQDSLYLTQSLPVTTGWIEDYYSPNVFSERHAQALDQGFYWAQQHPDPTTCALLKILMWHKANDFVAFSTSMGTSNRPFAHALNGTKPWQDINPKRFTDGSLKRLCQPVWSKLEQYRQSINKGVIGGAPVTHYQEDALLLLPKLTGDILYLDPPYAGTLSYEKSNRVIDSLLSGQPPIHSMKNSAFTTGTDALEELLRQANHIPIWVLSYGGTQLSADVLKDLVSSCSHGRNVEVYAKNYRHMSHVSKSINNQELLAVAYPKGGITPCH